MRFGELFGKSWREYKDNFKIFAVILLLLSVAPALIYFFISIPFNSALENLPADAPLSDFLSVIFNLNYLIPMIIFWLFVFLLSIWMSASFIYNALYRKKSMGVKETLAGGKKYFWRFLLFSIVYGIFLLGLFLLLIVPGIIFMVFWVFASYVLIGENRGILESLKSSRNIVRGRWWRTFGFILLFGLISIAISIGFDIVGGAMNTLISLFYGISIINELTAQASSLASSLITVPLGVLFFKNFYLDMKSSCKAAKKKK